MNDSAETKKLGQAVENLASTIVEIIESRPLAFQGVQGSQWTT